MLRFLFPRLTSDPTSGADLFRWAVREARAPHWYVAGSAPDTVSGRFAILATVVALVMVRLEREGTSGDGVSAALTERFVAAMEAEHREMGIGDPKLGRTVRKLVGALAGRVALWRIAVPAEAWANAARSSAYGEDEPDAAALAHTTSSLRGLWVRLDAAPAAELMEGRVE